MSERIRIGVILGPTACGKTAASILAAKAMNAEIISADSIQVYRGLDIGSAKPTMAERQGVPHHMLDVADVADGSFSAAEFQRMAGECIADIHSRSKFPLVVGGTGLYINALTYPLRFGAAPGDPELRARLQREEEERPGSMYERLTAVDRESAARLHPNDKKRIIRAVEVYALTGRTLTSFGADFANEQAAEPPYDAAIVGLTMDRAKLYERIERRVDRMLQDGLLDEVKRFAGHDRSLPALQGLGYRQLLAHFAGECGFDEAIEDIKRETRRFAKRQWTWFRRDRRIRWLDVDDFESGEALAAEIVRYMQKGGEEHGG